VLRTDVTAASTTGGAAPTTTATAAFTGVRTIWLVIIVISHWFNSVVSVLAISAINH
jgi:hypothetical protein